MKLTEIAARIDAHLRRIEADPKLNPPRPTHSNTRAFYNARAWGAGAYVRVSYVSYWNVATSLRKDGALKYLAWLDAGNVGYHYEAGISRR